MALPITLCGSISQLASPLGRSMHEAGYRALGLAFTYVPFEVSDLQGAIRGMRALGIRGFGVSQPFKQAVMPLLDELDPIARQIGAVNTIVASGGHLVGHNTDWIGAVRALEETRGLEGASVLILGAGGAARAIAFGLHQRQAHVTIANRTETKAEALARATGARPLSWDQATRRLGDYDVVVNATTLGQQATSSDANDFGKGDTGGALDSICAGQIVMDIVYKPLETNLLAGARARGATAVHGGRMLLHQAAAQFELYTGRPAPREAMDSVLRSVIGSA